MCLLGEHTYLQQMPRLKKVRGFAGYAVSDAGEVYTLHATPPRKLAVSMWDGYCRVRLSCPVTKKVYTKRVHILVAHAFVPGHRPGLVVDHINRRRDDNRAANLRWLTQSDNLLNTRMSARNRSGIRGVHRTKRGNWRAHATLAGKCVNLGRFKTKSMASKIRRTAMDYIHSSKFPKSKPIPIQSAPK